MPTTTDLILHWGHQVPVATNGAAQLPVPWPASPEESRSEAFKATVAAYTVAQNKANAEGRKSNSAANIAARPAAAKPASPLTAAASVSAPAAPLPVEAVRPGAAALGASQSGGRVPTAAGATQIGEYDRGAAEARALLSGEGVASPFGTAPASRLTSVGAIEDHGVQGAAAALELVGTPEQQRANRVAQASGLGATGSDAAAGAAEARRLLGKE